MSKYMIDNADNGSANSLNEIEKESSKGRNVNLWWSYKRKTLSREISYKTKLIWRTKIVENLNAGAIVKIQLRSKMVLLLQACHIICCVRWDCKLSF